MWALQSGVALGADRQGTACAAQTYWSADWIVCLADALILHWPCFWQEKPDDARSVFASDACVVDLLVVNVSFVRCEAFICNVPQNHGINQRRGDKSLNWNSVLICADAAGSRGGARTRLVAEDAFSSHLGLLLCVVIGSFRVHAGYPSRRMEWTQISLSCHQHVDSHRHTRFEQLNSYLKEVSIVIKLAPWHHNIFRETIWLQVIITTMICK